MYFVLKIVFVKNMYFSRQLIFKTDRLELSMSVEGVENKHYYFCLKIRFENFNVSLD